MENTPLNMHKLLLPPFLLQLWKSRKSLPFPVASSSPCPSERILHNSSWFMDGRHQLLYYKQTHTHSFQAGVWALVALLIVQLETIRDYAEKTKIRGSFSPIHPQVDGNHKNHKNREARNNLLLTCVVSSKITPSQELNEFAGKHVPPYFHISFIKS